MKRTLIVATTSYAGMGPYVSEIVNTFSPDEDVLYLFHDYEDDFFLKNVKQELHVRSTFYKKANNRWNKLLSMIFGDVTFDRLVLSLCKKYNVQCVHYMNGPIKKSLAQKLERIGVLLLGTVHDLHPHEAKKALHKMLRARVIAKKTKEGMDYNVNLVTNGQSQYEELNLLYPHKRIFFHAFPSLVSAEVINGREIPEELTTINKPYILFFGRIEEYKGIQLLYDVFTSTPELYDNYHLVIAGKGDLSFKRKNNEKGLIWMHRYVKDSEVRFLYENAKCVVYPYISATQSGVLSLAFYFQTPALTSDVPFFKSSIEPTGAGMTFRNGDISDLKNKLHEILHRDVDDIKEAEIEYYKSNYEGKAIHDKLVEIYNSLGMS